MKYVLLVVIAFVLSANAQDKRACNEFDLNNTNTELCMLPYMDTTSSDFVVAQGTWSPATLFAKNSDTEITCVHASVPQLSTSELGFCLMATGFILDTTLTKASIVGVGTVYLDITSWDKNRIVAEYYKVWEEHACENRQLVLDFPSNTVTLTSTLLMSKRCVGERDKMARLIAQTSDQPKPRQQVETFKLVHKPYDSFADEGFNPFLK